MRIFPRWTFVVSTLALVFAPGAMLVASGAEAAAAARHGGVLTKTEHYQFEILCSAGGLKVYPYDASGNPLDAAKLTASATFYHPSAPKPWFERALHASGAGQHSQPLGVDIDLSKLPAKGVKVALEVSGLPDPDEPKATFTVPFEVRATPAAKPALITYAKATSSDRAAIAAQRVCKVSGEDLSSMGGPVKVSRGDKSVFICCMGCLKTIQANPDRYFGPLASAVSSTK